jgi:hypothetical protein
MSLKAFIAALTPSLEKGRVLDTVSTTKDMLLTETLVPYKDAVQYAGFTGPMPFKSNEVKKFNQLFQRETRSQKNFIEATTLILSGMAEGWPVLEKAVELQFKNSVTNKLGLTYQKATIMRVISLQRFAARYARRMLQYMYCKEVPAAFKNIGDTGSFSNGEVKWLEQNAMSYCRIMKIFANPMSKILSQIELMPDVVFDAEKEGAVTAVVGTDKLNPMGMGFVPIISDVIWFVGSRWIDMQAAELQEAREEAKMLELRLAQLRSARAGENDAATDRVIAVNMERLKEANYEVVKLEKKYGVAPTVA